MHIDGALSNCQEERAVQLSRGTRRAIFDNLRQRCQLINDQPAASYPIIGHK